MKVVHLSTHDVKGGAAQGAIRLHQGLLEKGCDSSFFVLKKSGNDDRVIQFSGKGFMSSLGRAFRRWKISRAWKGYKLRISEGCDMISDERSQYGAEVARQLPECDICVLHWTTGFVDFPSFMANLPQQTKVILSLFDMSSMTGGCHYTDGCKGFTIKCGNCPRLEPSHENDLSRQSWLRKSAALEPVSPQRLHVVTVSEWIGEMAKASSLLGRFPVTPIHNAVDLEEFARRDKNVSREILGIPKDANVLLFAAQWIDNPRKGFKYLLEAIRGMTDVFLLTLGGMRSEIEIPVPHLNLGTVDNRRMLSMVYSAADVLVSPALQEALGNTIMESLACATPAIVSDVCGLPETVTDGKTGLLVPPGSAEELRKAIRKIFDSPAMLADMNIAARKSAEEKFGLELYADKFLSLFESMTK